MTPDYAKTTRKIAVESLVIDGEYESGEMAGCDLGDFGFRCPYALFSPELQCNVGGPYSSREHAASALQAMLEGKMIPFVFSSSVHVVAVWTVTGAVSPWYRRG